MGMTKKDFIRLADKVREYQEAKYRNHDIELEEPFLLDMLVEFCLEQNPRFKPSVFLGYVRGECGPNGGKVK